MNSRYEDAEVNEEELGKLKIHKKGKEDKLVVIFHAGLGSIDEFLPFIQGLCNEEKGTIVSIALNNVKQYLDFYAGHGCFLNFEVCVLFMLLFRCELD